MMRDISIFLSENYTEIVQPDMPSPDEDGCIVSSKHAAYLDFFNRARTGYLSLLNLQARNSGVSIPGIEDSISNAKAVLVNAGQKTIDESRRVIDEVQTLMSSMN